MKAILIPFLALSLAAATPQATSRKTAATKAAPAPAAGDSKSLADVLSHMDAASAAFETMVADISYTKVTVIVNDRSTEKGVIYFKRPKGKRDFKAKIEFREPS